MQREILEAKPLLDGRGHITEEGWARRPLWAYDRREIKAGPLRIKEWDYYYLLSPRTGRGLTLTMSDLGYAGLFAAAWLEFDSGFWRQEDELSVLPLGKTGFPADSRAGGVGFEGKKLKLSAETGSGVRRVRVEAPDLVDSAGERGLRAEIEFREPEGDESMCIATSWAENRRAFYYNRKTVCMPAAGRIELGGKVLELDPASDLGGLDWGRGRWTYRNRWYWSSASGIVGGERFGWNLGYGFSDRGPASENAVFHGGRAHKLGELVFEFDPADYLKPWRFRSDDGRFEADFVPILDRRADTNLLLIRSDQHQVFGRFTGRVRLDEGRRLEFKDLLGFAEDVYNRW